MACVPLDVIDRGRRVQPRNVTNDEVPQFSGPHMSRNVDVPSTFQPLHLLTGSLKKFAINSAAAYAEVTEEAHVPVGKSGLSLSPLRSIKLRARQQHFLPNPSCLFYFRTKVLSLGTHIDLQATHVSSFSKYECYSLIRLCTVLWKLRSQSSRQRVSHVVTRGDPISSL
jgi:hypothetical protein